MKLFSYLLMLVGLIFLGAGLFLNINVPLLNNKILTIGIGAVLIVGGILLMGKSSPQQSPEVPIYEGKGKKRKVVGYQRMKN